MNMSAQMPAGCGIWTIFEWQNQAALLQLKKQSAQNAISTAPIKYNQQVGKIVAQLETGHNAVKIIETLGYKTFTATAPGSFNKQILIHYLLRINAALLVDTLLLKSNCSAMNISRLEYEQNSPQTLHSNRI